jgi:hypothetical protein
MQIYMNELEMCEHRKERGMYLIALGKSRSSVELITRIRGKRNLLRFHDRFRLKQGQSENAVNIYYNLSYILNYSGLCED